MRVFISSVTTELEEFRDAAETAAKSLRYNVTKAEDFGAIDSSPQVPCLAGVRDADVVVLLLGERYGVPQESGLSATHEEYREAKELKPVLVLVQANEPLDRRQQEFVKEVQDWQTGSLVAYFSEFEYLRFYFEVKSALRYLELPQAVPSFDESEAIRRAREAVIREPLQSWETRTAETRIRSQYVASGSIGPGGTIMWPEKMLDTTGLKDKLKIMFARHWERRR